MKLAQAMRAFMAAALLPLVFGFAMPANAQGNDYILNIKLTDDDIAHIKSLGATEPTCWDGTGDQPVDSEGGILPECPPSEDVIEAAEAK